MSLVVLPPVQKNTSSAKEAMDRFIRWEENFRTHTPTSGTRYPVGRRDEPRVVALTIPKNRNILKNNEPVHQVSIPK